MTRAQEPLSGGVYKSIWSFHVISELRLFVNLSSVVKESAMITFGAYK